MLSCATPSGSLSLLALYSALDLPALFHAGSAPGFWDLQRISLRVQPAIASRRCVPLLSFPCVQRGPPAVSPPKRCELCEPSTFSGFAPKHEARLPANADQHPHVDSLAETNESAQTYCQFQFQLPKQPSAEIDAPMCPAPKRWLHEHCDATLLSPKRQAFTPHEPEDSPRRNASTLLSARTGSNRSHRSDRCLPLPLTRRCPRARRNAHRDSLTSAVVPGGLQGFEQGAESVSNVRSVTRTRRPNLSWPCAPPGCALHRLDGGLLPPAALPLLYRNRVCELGMPPPEGCVTLPTPSTLLGFSHTATRGHPCTGSPEF